MSEYSTSIAMIAQPIGERKIAERPADMPMSNNRRRSRALRPVTVAYHDPAAAVTNAIGPSRPADPPDPMVIADARSLSGPTRARIPPSF